MKKNPVIKIFLYTWAGMITFAHGSVAANLTIKNDDTANVEIVIQPGEGTTFASSPEIRRTLAPGKEEKMTVTSADMGGAAIFSIKGIGTMPTLTGNVCHELSINKNYQVTFSPKTLGGISCHHQPLPSAEKESKK